MTDHEQPPDPIEMPGAVTVTISTNVDLQRDTMTEELWADLGRYVADSAARVRLERRAAEDAAHGRR